MQPSATTYESSSVLPPSKPASGQPWVPVCVGYCSGQASIFFPGPSSLSFSSWNRCMFDSSGFFYANSTYNCWLHRLVPTSLWLHFVEEITWGSRVKPSHRYYGRLLEVQQTPPDFSVTGTVSDPSLPTGARLIGQRCQNTASRRKTRYNPWPPELSMIR